VHQVYTGVSVIANGIERSEFECTDVTFRELDDDIIARYIATGEPMDKAGAYAAQGIGATIIKEIRGSYTNVIGLPIAEVLEELKRLKIKSEF
jgi:septum formation protein